MTKPNDHQILTPSTLIEAIRRSGYLIESQLSQLLFKSGFFVEPNQVIKDPITGKSREIDLLAEYNPSYQPDRATTSASIRFAFEVKNNLYPVVLLTKLTNSPNVPVWESLREVVTRPASVNYSELEGFYYSLLDQDQSPIFTQYCSFKYKKDSRELDLMAYHPDELHDGIAKIVQHCDEEAALWADTKQDDYFRHFLYMPVVVLAGPLYELKLEPTLRLKRTTTSRLLYNYHWANEARCVSVYFVTSDGFIQFLKKMIALERRVEDDMVLARTAAQKTSPNKRQTGARTLDKRS